MNANMQLLFCMDPKATSSRGFALPTFNHTLSVRWIILHTHQPSFLSGCKHFPSYCYKFRRPTTLSAFLHLSRCEHTQILIEFQKLPTKRSWEQRNKRLHCSSTSHNNTKSSILFLEQEYKENKWTLKRLILIASRNCSLMPGSLGPMKTAQILPSLIVKCRNRALGGKSACHCSTKHHRLRM